MEYGLVFIVELAAGILFVCLLEYATQQANSRRG